MQKLKFCIYIALMTLVYAAVGVFLAFMLFMFLGHTTVAVLHLIRLTPTQFATLCGIFWAALGFCMGWSEGSQRYRGTQELPPPNRVS
jgi:hypothetical protein